MPQGHCYAPAKGGLPALRGASRLTPPPQAPTALAEAVTAPTQQDTARADFAGNFAEGPRENHKE